MGKKRAVSFGEDDEQFQTNKRVLNNSLQLLTIRSSPKLNEEDGLPNQFDFDILESDYDDECDEIDHLQDDLHHNHKRVISSIGSSDDSDDDSFQTNLISIGVRRKNRSVSTENDDDDDDDDVLKHLARIKSPKTKQFLAGENNFVDGSQEGCNHSQMQRGSNPVINRRLQPWEYTGGDCAKAFVRASGNIQAETAPKLSLEHHHDKGAGTRNNRNRCGDITHSDWQIEEVSEEEIKDEDTDMESLTQPRCIEDNINTQIDASTAGNALLPLSSSQKLPMLLMNPNNTACEATLIKDNPSAPSSQYMVRLLAGMKPDVATTYTRKVDYILDEVLKKAVVEAHGAIHYSPKHTDPFPFINTTNTSNTTNATYPWYTLSLRTSSSSCSSEAEQMEM